LSRARSRVVALAAGLLAASALAAGALVAGSLVTGCYGPNPKDGAFKCDGADGYLCPQGLLCDRTTNLCVHTLSVPDMAIGSLTGGTDGGLVVAPTCDVHVRAGGFKNPAPLAVSTAGDDNFVSVSGDGKSLLFSANGTPTLAAIDPNNPRTVSGAQAVTLTGPAGLVFLGGAFDKNGTIWVAGLSNANNTSLIYKGTLAGTTLTLDAMTHQPGSSCMGGFIASPIFVSFDPAAELIVQGPLAGCRVAPTTMVASGVLDRNFGAFAAAVNNGMTLGGPGLTPSGLTLLTASQGAGGRVYFATRATLDTQFDNPNLIDMGAFGTGSTRDVQMVVHPSCKVVYLVTQRAGGAGGTDIWVADIP
jgi:hypothetical protein